MRRTLRMSSRLASRFASAMSCWSVGDLTMALRPPQSKPKLFAERAERAAGGGVQVQLLQACFVIDGVDLGLQRLGLGTEAADQNRHDVSDRRVARRLLRP